MDGNQFRQRLLWLPPRNHIIASDQHLRFLFLLSLSLIFNASRNYQQNADWSETIFMITKIEKNRKLSISKYISSIHRIFCCILELLKKFIFTLLNYLPCLVRLGRIYLGRCHLVGTSLNIHTLKVLVFYFQLYSEPTKY